MASSFSLSSPGRTITQPVISGSPQIPRVISPRSIGLSSPSTLSPAGMISGQKIPSPIRSGGQKIPSPNRTPVPGAGLFSGYSPNGTNKIVSPTRIVATPYPVAKPIISPSGSRGKTVLPTPVISPRSIGGLLAPSPIKSPTPVSPRSGTRGSSPCTLINSGKSTTSPYLGSPVNSNCGIVGTTQIGGIKSPGRSGSVQLSGISGVVSPRSSGSLLGISGSTVSLTVRTTQPVLKFN